MAEDDLYEQIIAAVHAVSGRHHGRRALHSKGSWCEGLFTATGEAAALTNAVHFQGAEVPALIRFSNASGDPEAHDAQRDGRGIAVKLRATDGEEIDLLAVTTPTFVARTPEDFLELMRAREPDPATGEPDMEKLGAYVGAHPEALPAIQAVLTKEPLASFAEATYFSPHAYLLVGADGKRTAVRYRFVSDEGERRIPDDDARELGRDYLHDELAKRLDTATVGFELQLQLAAEDDPLDDSTAAWPEERELVSAGRLVITATVDDPERDGHIDVFDPTRVPAGVELSDDPVLHARRKAYSVSAYARLDSG